MARHFGTLIITGTSIDLDHDRHKRSTGKYSSTVRVYVLLYSSALPIARYLAT